GYPLHVFLVLANEFCERFSFYGMKAVLIFYLWKGLGYEEDTSTVFYHTFVVFCYATPILGAMIADGWLGKYKTILYVSIIYACGSILMTVSAIKFTRWLAFIALLVIAFGTGGIKPCVSSFGGDQFKGDQTRQKDSFFSLFYLTINIGSMISTLIIPSLRGNISCFGKDCYALCFGIPAILMIVSIALFVLGTKWYTINPPGESILKRFFGCIGKALSRKCCCAYNPDGVKKDHWLDYASPEYDQPFIEDVKDVMRVTWLFIPLPVFWTLFDQIGSKWTFQAQMMNGDFLLSSSSSLLLLLLFPLQFMNPLLVVVIVPFLEYVIYPCLTHLHIPNRPLQRMSLGLLLAAVSFLMTGFLQTAINKEEPSFLDNQAKYQIINAAPEDVFVQFKGLAGSASDYNYSIESLKVVFSVFINFITSIFPSVAIEATTRYADVLAGKYEISLNISTGGPQEFELKPGTAYQFFITYNKIYNVRTCSLGREELGNFMKLKFNNFSIFTKADDNTYNITVGSTNILKSVQSKNGPIYTLLLATNNGGDVELSQIMELEPWKINIFMQTPQYVVMSFGECLFSVTGLGFAYTQAPPSMKSILTAIWLLTVCIGNIIIIIVQAASSGANPATEFFIFSGLDFLTFIAFAVMSIFYTYVTPRSQTNIDSIENKLGNDNKGVELYEDIIGSTPRYDYIDEKAVKGIADRGHVVSEKEIGNVKKLDSVTSF
ncbi:hypothetical protein HELRODRAFT_90364, partial [Helobdella robusta]|uniref:Uncharacterized protein n=1 Tax=Helobdella robusta TaxID=6412 RepID=T1G7P9_HELRO